MQIHQHLWIVFGWLLCNTALGIDTELYQKYKNYQSYQQTQQVEVLKQARAAAMAGDFDQAERQLETARHMAYTPDDIQALEDLIQSERTRRETLARQERERQEQERIVQSSEQYQTESSYSVSTDALVHHLDWDYNYDSIYIPPTYKTKLKRTGILWRKYYFETSEDVPGYTVTDLDSVYFSVRLQNKSDRPMKVTYKVSARERFSVSRVAGNALHIGFLAVGGAAIAATLGMEPEAGAVLGGIAGGSVTEDNWFKKEKIFTTTLKPYEKIYDTGSFSLKKDLSEAPVVEILSVE